MKKHMSWSLSAVLIIVAIGFSVALIKADKVSAFWQNGNASTLRIEINSQPMITDTTTPEINNEVSPKNP